MQALTVAISPAGIQYLAHELIVGKLVGALSNLVPPNTSVEWDGTLAIRKFVVSLSGGSMASFTPRFSSLTQGIEGQFTLTLIASGCTVNYSWNEQFDAWQFFKAGWFFDRHYNHTWPYSMGIDTFAITVPITLSQQAQSYTLTVGAVNAVPSGLNPNIPPDSKVRPGPCFQSAVDGTIMTTLEKIDFRTPIQNLFSNLLGTIPASGKLTPDIVFNFNQGDTALAFPANAGLTLGVTGNVTWQGSSYSGSTPPSLGVPNVPAANHVHFRVADYEFNELFWAWFKDGRLSTTITAAQLPDPGMLNTNYYRSTPLDPLYKKYPSHQMTVGVTPQSPPTVTFQSVYQLVYGDNGVLTTQEAALPAGVYQALTHLQGAVYLAQTDCTTALQNALGPTGAQYVAQIEQAAAVDGPFVQVYQVTQVGLNTLKASLPSGVYANLTAASGGLAVGQTFVSKGWLLAAIESALADVNQSNQYGAQIAAAFAVGGSYNQVWWITLGTNGALTTLVDQLPPDVYNAITGLANIVYLDKTSLVSDLQNAIGHDAGKYETQIEHASFVNGAIVTQSVHATFNVIQAGQPVECFVVAFKETDFQQNFRLGTLGYTQTVQSDLQIVDAATSASLVSSKIPGLDGSTFPSIWNWALQPAYGLETQKMAHAGVPLPFMQGFQYLFNRATVQLQPGYADVLADMQYVGTQAFTDALMQEPGTVNLAAHLVQRSDAGQNGAASHGDLLAAPDRQLVVAGAANGTPTLFRTRSATARTRFVRSDDAR